MDADLIVTVVLVSLSMLLCAIGGYCMGYKHSEQRRTRDLES